jgi:hypothetical protein
MKVMVLHGAAEALVLLLLLWPHLVLLLLSLILL